jgi:hypothetical protein
MEENGKPAHRFNHDIKKQQPEAQARDGKQFTLASASGWCKIMNNQGQSFNLQFSICNKKQRMNHGRYGMSYGG